MIWERKNRKVEIFAKKRYGKKGERIVLHNTTNNVEHEIRFSGGARHRISVDSFTGKMQREPWSDSK